MKGSTANGVFSFKIMWEHLNSLINRLREVTQYQSCQPNAADMLSTIFPNLHYVWIRRRDTARQAVSYWKAVQTGVWVWNVDKLPAPGRQPEFNFEAIHSMKQEIQQQETAWQQYFTDNGIDPLTVVYEELVDAYEETALMVLHYLGIPIPGNLVFSERRLKKQADMVSEEWVERYHQIACSDAGGADNGCNIS